MKQQKQKQNENFSEQDYAFMHSLSVAMLEQSPRTMRPMLYFWLISITSLIIWMAFAEVDELVRGNGEVVPSSNNQIIQNLEGGIIEEIMVSEGDWVEQGQVLLKINSIKSESFLAENKIKREELEARIIRLQAEAELTDFQAGDEQLKRLGTLLDREQSLYLTNQEQLNAQKSVLFEQLVQRKNELYEVKNHIVHVKSNLSLINEEVALTAPVVEKGIKPVVDFLKLQREAGGIKEQFQALQLSIPRLKSAITEIENELNNLQFSSQSRAKKELNETVAEFNRLNAGNMALSDQVHRTLVTSPTNGIVQMLTTHTVGGVVRPGADLVEIVPSDDMLLIKAKISPKDIAFLYPQQKAILKFTAYDFAIYGGLSGKVVKISADSITDQQENTFYNVHIRSDKSYLGSTDNPLKIIPGMVVSVDIVTGKKTILDYILKPILRAKQYTFSER